MALCEYRRARYAEADSVADRAVELASAELGRCHPDTMDAMLLKAGALRALPRTREAREIEESATAYLRRNAADKLAGYAVDVREFSNPPNVEQSFSAESAALI